MAAAEDREKPACLRSRLTVSTRSDTECGGRDVDLLCEVETEDRETVEEGRDGRELDCTDRETTLVEATKVLQESTLSWTNDEAC